MILGHHNLKCFAFALKVDFKRKTAAGEGKKDVVYVALNVLRF